MESALTPREIQTRIRAGVSLDEVAKAAGVPTEKIEPYAAPVVAEREHVARTALTCPVRRTGESSSTRSLRAVVAERLQHRGIDVDDAVWDAWRDPDRRWTVQGRYRSGSAEHEALFTFDLRGRFSVAANDESRWLIGETTPSHGPQPGRRRRDPDSEPTIDLNDELALVRAIQPDQPPAPAGVTQHSRSGSPTGGRGEVEPVDYIEAELEEVDGIYDIVPGQTELDVLYDMLSSFNEDSVNIYAGLTRPIVDEDPAREPPASAEAQTARDEELDAAEDAAPPALDPTALSPAPRETPLLEVPPVETPAVATERDTDVPGEPTAPASAPDLVVEEPRQDPLVETGLEQAAIPTQEPPVTATKSKAGRARKRAHVPSWDEIVFGGPKKDPAPTPKPAADTQGPATHDPTGSKG